MTDDVHFDVAFSYAKASAWIARDLSNLIAQSGLSVYCADCQPGRAAGFLRANLLDIYRDSRLNVLVWSRSYSAAGVADFPSMERRCIVNRHIEKGAAESLFILLVDDEPLGRDLDITLAHHVRDYGIFGIGRLLIERIGTISGAGVAKHPEGTQASRGQVYPCEFTIDPNYQDDPFRRWRKLADVLVRFQNPLRTPSVYLIPSGACSPLLRHSVMLRAEPELLERKRRATEDFVRRHLGNGIRGFWFAMRKDEVEVTTVYAPTYDAALNASLREDYAVTAPGVGDPPSTAGSGNIPRP